MPEREPLNVSDYEQLAAERLEPGVHGYFAGGAGDELTLRENVAAFKRWRLRPRVLVDVGIVSARDDGARAPGVDAVARSPPWRSSGWSIPTARWRWRAPRPRKGR